MSHTKDKTIEARLSPELKKRVMAAARGRRGYTSKIVEVALRDLLDRRDRGETIVLNQVELLEPNEDTKRT